MLINEVASITNLSKKAIHFYIDEGLITPSKNSENGYHEFTQEDIDRLLFIAMLRKIDMPIQTIKEVFLFPRMANYFIHRQMYQLKNQVKETLHKLNDIEYIIDTMAPNATTDNLITTYPKLIPTNKEIDDSFLDHTFPSQDARMIAISIWGIFLEVTAGEYQQFLWHKMSLLLSKQYEGNLNYLRDIIYAISAPDLNSIHTYQYKITLDLTNPNSDTINEYVEKIIKACQELSSNKELQAYWQLTYQLLIHPVCSFSYLHASSVMAEYNPRYQGYAKNMELCCKNAYEELSNTYPEVLNILQETFKDSINLTQHNYSELNQILTFTNSIFTKLPYNKLIDILK